MKTFHQSPVDAEFVQNPYPFYATARAAGDFIWWEEYGMAAAVSHQAVSAVLRDRRCGREVPAELAPEIPARLQPFYDIEAHSMLELEPPRHTRLRKLVVRAFTSRRVAELAPAIRSLCADLVAAFPSEPFDLLDAYARPLPVTIIARLLGVPEDRAPDLLRWSNAMVAMYMAARTRSHEDAAVAATLEFHGFLTDVLADLRAVPNDGLLAALLQAEGDRLSTDELITTAILLLNAGHEATVHTLGNSVNLLLAGGHSPVQGTVEEALRIDPPLHIFTRHVYEDIEFYGERFTRGDQIACVLASANRDHGVWPDADRFDPTRKLTPHTSFGAGLHFCVGAPLARLELEIAFEHLFAACPTLRLAQPAEFADIYHFHGLKRLMVQT
jgi:cytochrome P450